MQSLRTPPLARRRRPKRGPGFRRGDDALVLVAYSFSELRMCFRSRRMPYHTRNTTTGIMMMLMSLPVASTWAYEPIPSISFERMPIR